MFVLGFKLAPNSRLHDNFHKLMNVGWAVKSNVCPVKKGTLLGVSAQPPLVYENCRV